MKRVEDCFFAGMVAGIIGGICHLLYNTVLILAGAKHIPFWVAVGGLFYSPKLIFNWSAQIHGMLDAIGISAVNGIITAYTLKITGKDYLYVKSVVLSAASAYFLFLIVYPITKFPGKNSLIVPWIALFGHTVFNGLLTGYIINKIYSFNEKQPKTESLSDSIKNLRRFYLSPAPAKKQEHQGRKVRLVKPKKY
ncbi:MAG: hypothetical protein AAGU27_22855 [Dehalobacterium sp.]